MRKRNPSANNNSRAELELDSFSDGNTTNCCEQHNVRKHEETFYLWSPVFAAEATKNIVIRIKFFLPPKKFYFSLDRVWTIIAYTHAEVYISRCEARVRCYSMINIGDKKCIHLEAKRQASTQAATTRLQRCHRSRQWHVCGSLAEREKPSSNVAAIDRYRPKCAKKKYFRRFMRASSTSHNAPRKCPLVLVRIVPAFMYVPCARPPATDNDGTSNAAGKKYVLRMWFVVAFTEREAGKEWIVKNACENDDTCCGERCA